MAKENGVSIKVRNKDLNKALNIFKKKMSASGVLREYYERQEFVKPSLKRREARKKAVREQKRREKRW